ncbi:MAG: hypothetical protein U0798_13590 [Gemmataceae bacterium]
MFRLFFLVGLFTSTFAMTSVPANDTPSNIDPASLINQLGSDDFSKRESASQELFEIGESTIPSLELAARNSTDAEIRRRARRVLSRIQSKVETAKFIAPKQITLDYQDVPLSTVIAELRQKTGIPLTLDPNGVKDPLRKVCVHSSGPVPVWEAVEMVAESSGLREVFKTDLPLAKPRKNRGLYEFDEIARTVDPDTVPVIFEDGEPRRLPGCRDTSVRILALPSSFPGNRVVRGSGEVTIHLDITPVSGVKEIDVDTIQVHHAIDETGRPVMASCVVEKPVKGRGIRIAAGGMIIINNRKFYGGPISIENTNPRIVPLTLRTDDRAITKLASFEGVVLAEASIPDVEVLKLENIENHVNTTFDIGPGKRMTITGYSLQQDGTTKLKLRMEDLPLMNRRQVGIMINPIAAFDVSSDASDRLSLISNFNFMDAHGKTVAKPKVGSMRINKSNFGLCQEIDLTYPQDNQPVHLTIKGTKSVTIEIPFKMTNVPLP